MDFIKENYNFKISDIDENILDSIVNSTVESIYNSPKARYNRSKKEIKDAVITGLRAEAFLIQYKNGKKATDTYSDVIIENYIIECKVSNYWSLDKCYETIKKCLKYSNPDYFIFWTIKDDVYTCYDIMKRP